MAPEDLEHNEELEKENLEELKELEEKEADDLLTQDTNKKALKTGLKGAANFYAPGSGKVVDLAARTKVGDAVLNVGSDISAEVMNKNFMTRRIQTNLKDLNKSGVLDAADSAVSIAGGNLEDGTLNKAVDVTSGAIDASGNEEELYEPQQKEKKENKFPDLESYLTPSGKFGKVHIFFLSFFIFFIFFIIFSVSSGPFNQLELTNNYASAETGTTSPDTLDDSYFEKKLLYVGDERIESLSTDLDNSNISYIHNFENNYNYLNEKFEKELINLSESNNIDYVVFNLGLYDLKNISSYIEKYKEIIENNKDTSFYFLSINPVDEDKTFENGLVINNKDIKDFNKELKKEFKDNYIDVYSDIDKNLLTEDDGIIYTPNVNSDIHKNVLSFLRTKEKTSQYSGDIKESDDTLNFPSSTATLPYFNQGDPRWAQSTYNGGNTMIRSGCGPTSLAMVVTGLTSNSINPYDMALWATKNNYMVGGAAKWDLMHSGAEKFGLKVEPIQRGLSSKNNIREKLRNKQPISVIMGKGNFTSDGHFIVLAGITEDDKVYVLDPGSTKRSKQTWKLDLIINESSLKQGSTANTFWAYSK